MGILGAWAHTYPYVAFLLILMGLDVLLGILRAFQDKKLSSDINGRGMRRKATMLILVLLGKVLETYLFDRYGQQLPVSESISLGFSISEILSILENSVLLGVPVPPIFRQILVQLNAHHAATIPMRLGDAPEALPKILEMREQPPSKNSLRPDIVEQALDNIEKDGV